MCDVVLVVEGKSLLAHKLVLASCSDYFFEKFSDVEQLLSLLKRNDLVVKNEYTVFDRVLSWVEVDKQRRIEYASELLD
ncbi:protein tramtrack, beta isoform-like [Patella vulgata]|uniref:protein tramtrack, beta isoform-like n=1 Tax=Patella vulgata TaxID=6465 RepID=UPI0024A89639|nr:protein tramtrack, beta isoform-like [Patella vulgata]